MISKVLKCFVFLGTLILHTHAFWWRPPTTTESPTMLKQIPLTYFRTYTYQPLTGGPYTFPFFGGGGGYGAPAPQAPMLAGARYEHYASSYPMPQAQHQLPPLIENQQFNRGHEAPAPLAPPPTTSTTTTTTTPLPPPTTTTTTTTTTPAPPPPTTTTTTSTPSTTTTFSAPPAFNALQQPIEPLINPGASISFATQYGASAADYHHNYNRRVFTNNYAPPNYYRPHYPYPEYSTFNTAGASKLSNSYGGGSSAGPAHVQFVPCMCPVSVGVPSGLPIVGASGAGPSTAAFLAQSRTSEDENEGVLDASDMELSHDSESTKTKIFIEPEVAPILEKSIATTAAELTPVNSHLANKLDEASFEKSAYEKLNEPLVALSSSSSSSEEV